MEKPIIVNVLHVRHDVNVACCDCSLSSGKSLKMALIFLKEEKFATKWYIKP